MCRPPSLLPQKPDTWFIILTAKLVPFASGAGVWRKQPYRLNSATLATSIAPSEVTSAEALHGNLRHSTSHSTSPLQRRIYHDSIQVPGRVTGSRSRLGSPQYPHSFPQRPCYESALDSSCWDQQKLRNSKLPWWKCLEHHEQNDRVSYENESETYPKRPVLPGRW